MSVTDARLLDYSNPKGNDYFLPPPAEDFANQGVEYLAARQAVQALKDCHVKYNPTNGGVYTKKSDFIEFRLNPQQSSWIDGTHTRLNLQYKPLPVTRDPVYNFIADVYAYGSFSTHINRVTISNGGQVLEDIQDYNRIYSIFDKVYCSADQLGTAPSIYDTYSGEKPETRTIGEQLGSFAASSSTWTPSTYYPSGGKYLSIPLSLSSLFGPGSRKAIPLSMLRENLTVRIYLESEIAKCYYAVNGNPTSATTLISTAELDATSDYQLTNVSLECKVLRYTDSAEQFLRSNINNENGTISWDGTTFISNMATTLPAEQNSQVLLYNSNYRDVKSIFCSTFYPTLTPGKSYAYQSTFPGLHRANVLVNGEPINSRDIGENNTDDLNSNNSQFVANILSVQRVLADIWETNTELAPRTSIRDGGTYNPYVPSNDSGDTTCPIGGPNGYYIGRTDGACDQKGPFFGEQGDTIQPGNLVWAISTLVSNDSSRQLVGRDFTAKQVVVEMWKKNRVPADTKQTLHAVLAVGQKFHLDVRSGQMYRTL